MRTCVLLLLAACSGSGTPESSGDPSGEEPHSEGGDGDDGSAPATTEEQLAEFYAQHGGRDALPPSAVRALEALLYAQDEIEAGELEAARARIDAVFDQMPLYDDAWTEGEFFDGSNIGHPVAYYGLRMLDQTLRLAGEEATGSLQMTAVVAPCADVTRPTLPDLTPETVRLDLSPEITEARLHLVTALFRRWVQAITGGLQVELVVHTLSDCTTVDYTDDGSVIVSYPDAGGMVAAVPDAVADATDFWWVVAPSGVPGDGTGYGRHFITGGMSGVGAKPLFLSDDAWFTRKPEHLGEGAYTEAELRAYQPQWFQHEFMHHLYRTWPEFGLEETGHQWFDRTTWPDDFEGRWEPDYYAESIDKRLLAVDPSLAEVLGATYETDPSLLTAAALAGVYERQPVENTWHKVTVTGEDGALLWTNAAGASWPLVVQDGELWTTEACPYGEQSLRVEGAEGTVSALHFLGEPYRRVEEP